MDEAIRHQLKVKKVREMKNPVIAMNDMDLHDLIEEVKSKVQGFEPTTNPTYEGIPIKESKAIERGTIIVYDDIFNNLENFATLKNMHLK